MTHTTRDRHPAAPGLNPDEIQPMPPHSDALCASVVDLLLDAVCVVDAEGHFVFVSAACEAVFGYTPEEMVGRRMIEMVAPEDRDRTLQAAQRIMSGQTHLHFENRYLRKDGRRVDIMWSARWSPSDRLRIAVARDVTARKRAESMQAATYAISEAAHAAEDMPALLQKIHQVIGQLLPCHHFAVALVDEASGQLGFPYCVDGAVQAPEPPTAAVVAFCHEVIRGEQARLGGDSTSWLGAPLTTQKGVMGAVGLNRHAQDAPYTEEDRELLQYVSTQIASAIERQRLYARLRHMAQYDELTDLPNRGCLQDRLDMALARARREHRHLSLLYLDLDKFKQVNDDWGHATGDRLLKAVAHRLKGCVRASDTVARMSGDEFVVLLESSHPPEGNGVVAHKISDAFDAPFDIDGQRLHIRPSLGVALYPEHGTDGQQLLRHADNAMYVVKHSRR